MGKYNKNKYKYRIPNKQINYVSYSYLDLWMKQSLSKKKKIRTPPLTSMAEMSLKNVIANTNYCNGIYNKQEIYFQKGKKILF